MSGYIPPTATLLDPSHRDREPAAKAIGITRGSVKSVQEDQRTVQAVVSTNRVDRDQEVVIPSAFEKWLDIFLENPVFCAGHQYVGPSGKSTVIGHWIDLHITDDGLVGTVKFAETPLGEDYWQLYKGKHLRAFSCRWQTHQHEFRELDLGGGIMKRIRVFTEVELLEISAVAIPANRDALAQIVKRSKTPQWPDESVPHLTDPPRIDEAALRQIVRDEIGKSLSPDLGGPLSCLIQDVVEAYRERGEPSHLREESIGPQPLRPEQLRELLNALPD